MLTDRHFPYSSMQEINLDWILTKVKNILRFVPDDGAVGQILRRTAHGAEWSNEQGGGGAVTSVNGQTGDVILSIPTDTSDLNNDSGFVDAAGAAAAAPVQSVNGQTGAVTLSIPTDTSDLINDSGFVDAAGAAAAAPVQSVSGRTGTVVLGKSDVGLGNVDNVQQYSASNPPPYPVTSVNGQTGAATVNIRWVSYTATSDAWGQIVIPANVVAPTEEVIAVKTIGCYSTPIALTNTQENWVLTVLQNNNANLTPWAGLYTVIYIGIFEG